MAPTAPSCTHAELQLEPSPHATVAGFQRLDASRLAAAATPSGRPLHVIRNDTAGFSAAAAFPAPLVLPGDDLALDPRAPPQSFRSWLLEPHRNHPEPARRTLYVAAPPTITAQVAYMRKWKDAPADKTASGGDEEAKMKVTSPGAGDVIEYLSAFYHGLDVRAFPQRLRFVPWDGERDEEEEAAGYQYVGLTTREECTRIRARPAPDGAFARQLSLEDVLDAAMAMLPADAYALLVMTDHDLYEDEDDDFCCGRAYGGSRVAVVSAARYHPRLDAREGIDRSHMWPASHCGAYVRGLLQRGHEHGQGQGTAQPPARKKARMSNESEYPPLTPLRAAFDATLGLRDPSTTRDLAGLWLSRVARTAAHELGHCLGMGHCVYYACCMQSTAGMAEDVRQPPYLCLVCLAKITHGVVRELGGGDEKQEVEFTKKRYTAIVKMCQKWKHIGMFTGYEAWARARLDDLAKTE